MLDNSYLSQFKFDKQMHIYFTSFIFLIHLFIIYFLKYI